MRGTHFGRYGAGATDDRLSPLFLGFGQYVRGYSAGSFGTDPEFALFQDRLFGPRIGIATAELRMPLLGVSQLGLLPFPFLPTELVLFADAGMAWGEYPQYSVVNPLSGEASPLGTPFRQQKPIVSTGVSARVNLLGALIVEPYLAFPLSRYVDGGLNSGKTVFGVNLMPGW